MNVLVLITTLVLAVAGAVYLTKNNLSEGFWMTPSRSVKVEKMFRTPDSPDFFQVPNFQSMLSPRFSNVGYGANLQGRMPPYGMLGVPSDPLMNTTTSLNMTASTDTGSRCGGYEQIMNTPIMSNSISSCEPFSSGWQANNFVGAPKTPLVPNFGQVCNNSSYNNYQQTLNDIVEAGGVSAWPTSTVGTPSSAMIMGEDGQITQPIIYDRYIYANRNSRQRGQGDPIRGDLPIVPVSGQWFIPSQASSPNLSLQQGALSVLGGWDNGTSQSLANLIWNSSGGSETTFQGVDLNQTNMCNTQVLGAVAAAQGDVVVKGFP